MLVLWQPYYYKLDRDDRRREKLKPNNKKISYLLTKIISARRIQIHSCYFKTISVHLIAGSPHSLSMFDRLIASFGPGEHVEEIKLRYAYNGNAY